MSEIKEKKEAPKEHHKSVVVVKKKDKKKDSYAKAVQYCGTGRRKNAIARVFLFPGKGSIKVNDQDGAAYFDNRPLLLSKINKPLKTAGLEGKYDAFCTACGGGKTGQAGAVAHGIARAIVEINADLKKMLKIEGLLTRDPRVKERKKYGRKKARKGFTYRKR
jgi:small subunit ribosomal protein S9